MIQTAVSVARNCGMVRPNDKVIIVNGYLPDKENPSARIDWELAEAVEDPELVAEDDSSATDEVREMGCFHWIKFRFFFFSWGGGGGCCCLNEDC